jgi:sugar phosphate isomerase/epimerase
MRRLLLYLLLALAADRSARLHAALPATGNFARTNLVAWCIVPFDTQKRGPEERAAMLDRLGVKRLAYDWRAEHIPSFDAEVAAMRKHGIELTAWWFPAALNDEAKAILACLERTKVHPQLWVTMGTEPEPDAAKLAAKLDGAVTTLAPICEAAAKLGCTVALYNHLGWFGEPANQVAIIAKLKAAGHTNVGSVYNFHHAHAHLSDFAEQFRILQPHLLALNLNGMVRDGDKAGKKIIPLGTGDEEVRLLQIVNASGWRGPVGIIGHTEEDAEVKLRKELDGLEKLAPLVGPAPSPVSGPRTPSSAGAPISDPARADGNQRAGSETGAPKKAAGEPAISGREPASQGEKDWVDNRWQDTDVGPFLASNLRLPDGSVIAKALTIRVGEHGEGAVVYDTETCTLRAAWTGGFLTFDAGRFGLIGMPKAGGEWVFSDSKVTVSEISSAPHFAGVGVGEGRVVLQYSVDGTRVLELPGLEDTSAGPVVRRVLSVDPHSKPLRLLAVADLRGQRQVSQTGEREFVVEVSDGKNSSVMVVAGLSIEALAKRGGDTEGPVALSLDAADRLLMFSVLRWQGPASKKGDFLRALTNSLRSEHLSNLHPKANSPHWPTLTTRGQRGADADFLAVDTLTLPYDNPAKALLFASGIDFTPDGAGYVCTIHGDVWRVTGIDDSLRELKWQRYATGLFQTLGLKVRDGKVFVLGRDRITRLHDKNGDGEADFYENFFDGIATSTGGHDYVTCLETDAAGNFYYVDPLGLHRVAADGSRQETLATGFRNPNGMGVRADGQVLTAAPQQGTWTPSSGIWEVRPDNIGLYGGYGGPKVTATRPLGYDAPLCWLPHGVDNSSGSQVWIPPGQWGPLGGQMLHLLWGRCTAMLVLRDETGGTTPAVNGAAVPLPVKFLSGPNRATFHPKDGALYVAGSTGWQTSAVKDGALQRVRFTGKTPGLPVRWAVKPGGLELTFSRPVDPSTAADPGSYGFKQWNYRYTEQYGSKDWSVADPQKEGRDEIPVKAARVLAGGRSVFLELPRLRPVMQFELKYNLDSADGGKALRGSLWGSINRVP